MGDGAAAWGRPWGDPRGRRRKGAAVYILRQHVLPALGKGPEVQAQLTDWVQYVQAQGRQVALLGQLFSAEGPALVVSTRAEDLNALERHRRESLAGADFQARAARLAPLLRGPVATVVAEVVIPVGGGGPVGVIQAATGFPAPGQERRYREITEAFVQDSQAAGVRIGMGVRVFSAIGPVVGVTSAHPDLAALERERKARAEAARPVLQALAELSREPLQVRVFEVLVPYPS
jgi:hypothetical protein